MPGSNERNFDITKTIGVITVILICIGITSKSLYYWNFNIVITDYMSASEVLLLFTHDLIRSIILIIAFAFYVVVLFTPKITNGKNSLRQKRKFIEFVQESDFWNKRYLSMTYSPIDGLLSIIALIGLIWIYGPVLLEISPAYEIFGSEKGLLIFVCLFEFCHQFVRSIVLEFKGFLRKRRELTMTGKSIAPLLLLSSRLFWFILSLTIYDVWLVKFRAHYDSVDITLNDGTLIKSNNSEYYIGQTGNYVFYYYSETNTSKVLKWENISEISFGSRSKQNICAKAVKGLIQSGVSIQQGI